MAIHWHAMNGSSGCLPDNNEVHTSKEDAIESLLALFEYSITDDDDATMREELQDCGIYYFTNPQSAGADYAQVTECHEEDCLQGED